MARGAHSSTGVSCPYSLSFCSSLSINIRWSCVYDHLLFILFLGRPCLKNGIANGISTAVDCPICTKDVEHKRVTGVRGCVTE